MGSAGSPSKIRVAIAGAGIGGLCLAAGLIKYDHLDVQVYEAVASYANVGGGLALHANAIRAMELIDPEIKKAYFRKALSITEDPEEEMATQVILAYGPNSGEVVAQLGRAKGRKTVARADLLDGLLELSPRKRVHFGKRLVKIEENDDGVLLTFKDSTTATADCLVGADGIHSCTRRYLLGEDHAAAKPVNHDGWAGIRRMVPMEEAKQILNKRWWNTVPIMCGPNGYLNCMPLQYGQTLSASVIKKGVPKGDLMSAFRKEDFEGYSDDARAVLELVFRDPGEPWIANDHDPAPFYHKGRVVIAGDSGHATYPFSGNGAAQAIEDGAVLFALFAKLKAVDQVPDLFAAFDTVRRPRSQKVVEIAREFGRLYAYDLEGVWDDAEKMKNYFKDAAAFTNDADLQQQNDEAVRLFDASMQ